MCIYLASGKIENVLESGESHYSVMSEQLYQKVQVTVYETVLATACSTCKMLNSQIKLT